MKKILVIFIAVLLSSSAVFAASELIGLTNFIDVIPGSWYESAVAELQQKKIIRGYDDGTYKPSKDVNRAEMAIVISKALGFIAHPAGIDAWQRYINDEFLFVIDYPASWEPVEIAAHAIGFRPPWMEENKVQWAVIVYDNTPDKFEELIAEMGAGYPDTRSETRQQIKLNDKDVWHVIVTASERPAWRHEQVFVPHFNKLYVITNGAIENRDFELFWRSLKFLEPPDESVTPPDSADGETSGGQIEAQETQTGEENPNESNDTQQ